MDKLNKVLFIGAVWPEPNSSAGGTRLMQLIHLFLNAGCKVDYCSAAAVTPWMEDLNSLGVNTFGVKINDSSFDVKLAELQPEVVVFDRFMVEEQFGWRVAKMCPNAIRIIETIDLHCLRLARKELLKGKSDLQTLLLESEVAKRELAAIYRSDLSLIISTAEMKKLQEFFKVPSDILYYLPFRVDLNEEKLPEFDEREGFISIGNFKHAPNWDAVQYLKQEIFPKIRKELPKANLYVYGSYCDDKALQLSNSKQGFHVLGRAENAREVMKKAKVCLAPLRFGAGIKGKLIESMVCGTPNVTTSIGAEGMKEDLSWNGFIHESSDELASSAVQLYQNKTLWNAAQLNGFELLKQNFNSGPSEKKLLELLVLLSNELQFHRRNNFIGSMLMHHTVQSTKYLSKWIEEKNK